MLYGVLEPVAQLQKRGAAARTKKKSHFADKSRFDGDGLKEVLEAGLAQKLTYCQILAPLLLLSRLQVTNPPGN